MRVSSYAKDDGMFVAGSSRGHLWHVKGSQVIRLGAQSNGRSAHTLRKAKESQTKKHRHILFASQEQTGRNTGGFDGKSVLLAKRLRGGCAILSKALETTHSFRKQPLQGTNCAP